MTTPSLFGWFLLVWLLVILPRAAMRSARAFQQAASSPDRPLPTRSKLFLGTMYVLLITFAISWVVARDYDSWLFYSPPLGAREYGIAALALVAMLGLRYLSLVVRTAEERATMPVRRLLPRNRQEWVLYCTTAVTAGIAEEAAYRGAIIWVLMGWLGMPWLAVLVSATAFAVAHMLQGWKSMVVIFGMALVMHGVVYLTGTLVVAMVVHAVYDVLAGVWGSRGWGMGNGEEGTGKWG